jgi:hypothetical protein
MVGEWKFLLWQKTWSKGENMTLKKTTTTIKMMVVNTLIVLVSVMIPVLKMAPGFAVVVYGIVNFINNFWVGMIILLPVSLAAVYMMANDKDVDSFISWAVDKTFEWGEG